MNILFCRKYSLNYYQIDDYEMEQILQASSDKELTVYNYLKWIGGLMRSP